MRITTATICFVLLFAGRFVCGAREIPDYPCEFYGLEEIPGGLPAGSLITAKDPDGLVIGSFTVTSAGNYGFLSVAADDLDTPADEGARAGDSINFFVNNVPQQNTAMFKPGDTVRFDIGRPLTAGAYQLHLTGMPGYHSDQFVQDYSAPAVADMILDFLDPVNTDTQSILMSYADADSDGQISCSEMERLLNDKAPSIYHFGSTAAIAGYASAGYIDSFISSDQAQCLRQLCHWLVYRVPGAPAGKEQVPAAVCTSADPASFADSDYRHWMSVVGVKTNQDPFPALGVSPAFSDYYRVSGALQVFGLYVNDPNVSGLGFHSYITADTWAVQYFRPIAAGLEFSGSYIAVMEPPESKTKDLKFTPAQDNPGLRYIFETPQSAISVYIPGWVEPRVKSYLAGMIAAIKRSPDIAGLLADPVFGQALNKTQLNRCYKVEAKAGGDYVLLPFDDAGGKATKALLIMDIKTGQLRIASVDNNAVQLFKPWSWTQAYLKLRRQIGWSGQYPLAWWLSSSQGSPVFPGWSAVIASRQTQGSLAITRTSEYLIPRSGPITLAGESPAIRILDRRTFESKGVTFKVVVFEADFREKLSGGIIKKNKCTGANLAQEGNQFMLVLRGKAGLSCLVEVKDKQRSSYLELR